MAVWVSGVLLLGGVSVVTGSCQAGRYGYRCSYQSHCSHSSCNSTSGCQPASCSRRWSGSTCQKAENLALGKTTSSSSVYSPPSNAVNGDTRGNNETRCFHSAFNDVSITSAWWRVDLGEVTLVHDVIIYFRISFKVRRNGIQIYTADTAASPTDGVNCYSVTGNRNGTDIPDVLTVTCSGEGRYLVLYTTTVNNEIHNVFVPVMDFCEVEVEVCGPGTFGADCDNHVSGICPSRVCQPGWQTDRCDAVCGVDSHGTNCSKVCTDRHCNGDSDSCDHDVVTGLCVDGCDEGWEGTDCTEKCVNSYREGCAYRCSSRKCKGTSTCNHVTGKCERGCAPGWKNVDCTEACILGIEYGADCVGNCSARVCEGGNDTCPRDTGRCGSGCQPGWMGEDCTQVCSLGTYGANCSGTCGQCRDSKTCHQVTGACPDGCSDGWTNHTCTQVVKSLLGNGTGQISHLAAGFMGAVTMLVLLAAVIGAVCLWRKGGFRIAKTSKESGTPETSPAPPVEVPTCDVLPEHDYTKLDTIHTEHYESLQSSVDYHNSDVRI